jgi:UDP-GlcNAc:undecaprenyl-phosphate GlcNAc-1-phosphate transferase
MINAMNMVDGIDGAAGCLALASLILLASVCVLIDNVALGERIVLFMGVTTGFLLMNLRHPRQAEAQVFLGNAGSAVIGFGLAWLVVRISQTTAAVYSTIFPLWFLALPCIDACVVVLRRLHDRRSPFHGDREHLHHLMLAAGYAPTRAALAMGGLSLLLGASVVLAAHARVVAAYQIAFFAALVVLYYWFTRDRERAVRSLRRWNGSASAHSEDRDAQRFAN